MCILRVESGRIIVEHEKYIFRTIIIYIASHKIVSLNLCGSSMNKFYSTPNKKKKKEKEKKRKKGAVEIWSLTSVFSNYY